jgi:DNA-binding NarL/FixJ family response regulator
MAMRHNWYMTILHQVTAFGFTTTEERVAVELLKAKSNAEIAEALGISVTSVKSHLYEMMQKSGTHNRMALMLALLDVNLDEPTATSSSTTP